MCQLDKELFTCCKCGGKFNHIDGTWLPIGVEEKEFVSADKVDSFQLLSFNFSKPEVITSDKFTCYNCL